MVINGLVIFQKWLKDNKQMEQNLLEYLYNCFTNLIEKHAFHIENELNDGQSFSIEYHSNIFIFKLEKYRREFYATVYKSDNNNNDEIALFNLLKYLNRNSSNVPESNYFKEEDDIEECFKKQLCHISTTLYENYSAIICFFENTNYNSEIKNINNFMISKYPELFKRL
jgi:hypothetical protein